MLQVITGFLVIVPGSLFQPRFLEVTYLPLGMRRFNGSFHDTGSEYRGQSADRRPAPGTFLQGFVSQLLYLFEPLPAIFATLADGPVLVDGQDPLP